MVEDPSNRRTRRSLRSPVAALRSVMAFDSFERDPDRRRIRRAASQADLRRIARRRVPRGVFDYLDGAAEDELTARANRAAYDRRTFSPRVLVDVAEVDPSTDLFGRRLPMPVVLAPTGFTRMFHPDGELAVARSAARADLPYTLSTLATRSIEEVAEAADGAGDGPRWFQVYVWRDRGLVEDMVARAKAHGYEALVLTVDNAVLGRRDRDVRNGFTLPPKLGLRTLVDGVRHPSWTWAFATAEPITFANVSASARPGPSMGDGTTAASLSAYVNTQFDPGVAWADLDWLRSIWDGPLLLKGIQSVDDARRAVDAGVEGIVLSNHGGRQLDSVPATLDLVAPVRDAVGDGPTVLVDGGVRRGSDVLKAVALGADAVQIGRAYLYGLAAAGEVGVTHVLDRFADDLRRTMALLGVTSIDDVGPDALGPDAPDPA